MSTGGEDPEGQVVAGRYRLGPVIGVGSSAVVRRGRDLRDGVRVAVKLFHPGATADDRRQQRREMDALSRLDHPGLVGLRDGGTVSGRPFVVTDLVEGPTLAQRIGSGPVPADRVRRMGAQLADALAHVHAGGIVHRDVKPANVLLGDGSRAHLADFGIAKGLDGADSTEAGMIVGTAAFLAPEQARGQDVGPPADVYALGLVLLEALTGRREYPGRAAESATARLHRRPTVPADLPDGLGAVLDAMTQDDPATRPTAAEVAAALTAPSRHRRGARHRRSAAPGRPARRAALPVAAAAALLLAAGFGAVALLSPPPVPATASTPAAPAAP
ncbi:serine/threonine protein kinase [Pseudonocardia sp. KRD-184]|uniref:non-specific serine/threonine protein kinase n=1 Tax=Pseudonocardia oceani TaxID=2792013 RepID=A0ABS6U7P8_9PSEU|nr:serine/threonine-protein kinase [Pseudonocardia oceani]MBW0091177.1 serine/threonine protein kinase [Pseudonocardia oceani]MBW0098256.1 serine/threonine protein kinase [Pseudonocardia oceani]MBW0110855.1 serine/threonine protein kinase [Pseudonocardia oceani]MBW0122848.1 serine/threonine protein kinase [Pseudonocardia oceani]MBW0128266.1 serine/threonine protein kinase [Pseudonocardia oceani]